MSDYSKGEQESWNMATATLKRLSDLLTLCSIHAQRQDSANWYLALMDLRRNMAPFMEDTEQNVIAQELNKLPEGWTVYLSNRHPIITPKIHMCFDTIYIIMVKAMKDKGLLMPKTTDVRKAIAM